MTLTSSAPAARGYRFLTRQPRGRRQNSCLALRLRHGLARGGVLTFALRPGGFARRLGQPPQLRLLGRPQAQAQFLNSSFQERRRAHYRQLVSQLLVLVLQLVQAHLAFLALLAELGNLVFLPDIADSRPANQQAQQKHLQRRSEPVCRRLIFSISRHIILRFLLILHDLSGLTHPLSPSFSITRICPLRLRGFAATSASPGRNALRCNHFSSGARGLRNSGTSIPLVNV